MMAKNHARLQKGNRMNEMPPPIRPKSSGHGCLKASGIGCLAILIALGVAAYVGVRFAKRQYQAVMQRYEREGYKKVEGQIIEVTEPVSEPTIFIGQVVRVKNGSDRGMVLLCQSGEIDGKIVGNVHFVGQMLTVHKGAELMRDLEVTAQVVNLFGKVDGKITGVYQALNREPEPSSKGP
jgi:hypothetical protein